MPRRPPEQVISRAKRAWERKRYWYGHIYECWMFAAPGMNPYFHGFEPGEGSLTPGVRRHQHLYDSTLPRAAERLPNRMVNDLFPRGEVWAPMKPGPLFSQGQLPEDQEMALLANVQERIYAAIHSSGLRMPLVMLAWDGCISGTGLMKVGISRDAATLLEFEAVNQAECAFEAGPNHQVWGFYRKLSLTAEWIRIYWPDAQGVPAADMDDKPTEPRRYKVHEATYYDSMSQMWYYDIIIEDLEQGNRRVYERDYLVSPWVVWRYALLPGEVQGRSPVMAALPSARTLNHAKRVRLESASLRVAGMFTYLNDSTFNPRTVRLRSGAFLQVGSDARDNPTIRPLEVSGDVQLGELVAQEEKADIREIMHDYPQPEPTPQMTAFEFSRRDAEAKQNRGHPYERMAEEVGRPLLRIITYLMSEAGLLPDLQAVQPPLPDGRPSPLLLDGSDVRVEFASPLAQAQRMEKANRTLMWVRQNMETVGPDAVHRAIRTEIVPTATGEDLDMDEELFRTEDEQEQMAQAAQQAQQQQAGQAPVPPGQIPT